MNAILRWLRLNGILPSHEQHLLPPYESRGYWVEECVGTPAGWSSCEWVP